MRSASSGWVAVLLWVVIDLPLSGSSLPPCTLLDIDQIGWQRLESVKRTGGVDWWIELDDRLVVCGEGAAVDWLARGFDATLVAEGLDLNRMYIAGRFHSSELDRINGEVIAYSSGVAIVVLEERNRPWIDGLAHLGKPGRVFVPAQPNSVVVQQAANAPPRRREVFDRGVQDLVDGIDGDRWFGDIVELAAYNRYTHSPGVLDARDWLVIQFSSLPGLQVTTPQFIVDSTVAYNVVAKLVGRKRPQDWYIVGGHYDAISEIPQQLTPGAEDNASGCAGVLEMARIFAANPPDATMLFICYSGEEQGLFGSEDHVADLIATGDLGKVQTMLNLDMIGYTSDSDFDCLLETDPFAQFLLPLFTDAAAAYTDLRIVTSTFAWGSDHVPYLDAGVPALLTIENDWFEYPHYHTSNDLPQFVTVAMGEEILKMNVAAMAELVGTPSDQIFADGFESGDVTAWSSWSP